MVMVRLSLASRWLVLVAVLTGAASPAAAQVTVDFHNKGTVSTAGFRESTLAATPELQAPVMRLTQYNGLGIVGGAYDAGIDPGESVLFTLDLAATGVSYFVQFAQDANGNGRYGETAVEGYGADGVWLGTVTLDGIGPMDVSAAFAGQPLTAVRVRPTEAMRIYSFSYTPVPLPATPQGLVGRAKGYKVNLAWRTAADADVYRVFRKLDGEAAFSELGTTIFTAFVDSMPAGTASAQYYVVAENSLGGSPPSATITVFPTSR